MSYPLMSHPKGLKAKQEGASIFLKPQPNLCDLTAHPSLHVMAGRKCSHSYDKLRVHVSFRGWILSVVVLSCLWLGPCMYKAVFWMDCNKISTSLSKPVWNTVCSICNIEACSPKSEAGGSMFIISMGSSSF